jgi:hypothetical protein
LRAQRIIRACIWLLATLAGTVTAAAQSPADVRVIPLGIFHHEFRKDGRDAWQPIAGVKAGEIRIKGIRARVRSLELDIGPRRIILLLDMSGSMADRIVESYAGQLIMGSSRWGYGTDLAEDFLGFLQPADFVSLDVFATKHQTLVPFTHDFALAARQIGALPIPGAKASEKERGDRTRLGKALAEIVAEIENRRDWGVVVVLVSDGEYTVGSEDSRKEDLNRLAPRLAAAGMRVILLICRPQKVVRGGTLPQGQLPTSEYFDLDLVDFVASMGGATICPWGVINLALPVYRQQADVSNLREAASTAYQMAHRTYLLELEVLDSIQKPRKFSLELLDSRGRVLHDVELLYPHYLAPPPSSAPSKR